MSFNFGSRTFAFLRVAQGLNRSLSAFISVVREYLDPLVKADRCAQYVDKDVIFDINESLLKATKLSLKLPLPDKQLIIMCDASEHAAGYVLLTEDYSETQSGSLKKYAPVAFGSKKFQGGQMSLTMYAKEFLAMHFAFDEFGHILWGAKKPIIVMTDNKALTRFFQAKHIPPSL